MTRPRPGRLPTGPALLMTVALSACGIVSSGEGPDGLDAALERWERNGLASYTWRVDRSCYCGAFGEAEIRVLDGEKVSVIRPGTGEPVPPAEARWFPTVDELFEVVEEARRDAHALEVEYDQETGAPLLVDIDWIGDAIDDEIRYTATSPVPGG